MEEIPQKNEEILVVESLPENKEIERWELFDIVWDWWNIRYPDQVNALLCSKIYREFCTFSATADELFDVIFDWLNNEYPYKMAEYMACPNGHAKYCDRRGIQ